MNYYIIADETCDLPEGYKNAEDFKLIPLSCSFDGVTYINGTDKELTREQYFNFLNEGKIPTTSQINPFTFEENFRPILAKGQDIICFLMSSAISGTYESAVTAAKTMRNEFPDRKIYVVDTKCASGGFGLLMYYTLKAREDGLNIDSLFDYVENLKLKICHYFTVDNLKHLFRTGRVSKASAIIGSMLSVKPLLHVDDNGALIPIDKCMGRKASLNWLVNKMVEKMYPEANKFCFLYDAYCSEDQDFTAAKIKEKFPGIEVIKGQVGNVITSHSGLGTMALFFVSKNGRKEN